MAARRAELAARVRDEKAPPEEALLLARLLDESGHPAEALDVLRQNAQRHPTDRLSLAALARGCMEEGFLEEEETTREKLYQLPAPLHERLELLRQLAIAMQSHGRLRLLREAWVQQRKGQPMDAYGWLELAVVHARAGEDEESRRCVHEASRLRPQDVELLREIARREAGHGFLTEALSTLDAADKVAKSGSTELLRCLILLNGGEQAQALARLAAFTLPADVELKLVLATADALAEGQAWREAVRLLDQATPGHTTNYQLQYQRALALEEKGDRDAAVTTFLAMLALDAEVPADASLGSGSRHRMRDDNHWMEGLVLPAGASGLLQSLDARRSAYNRRHFSRGSIIDYVYTQVMDGPPAPFIALPQSLIEAKHLAVAHLQRLLPSVAAARRTEAEKAVVAGGLEEPEVLLDAAGIRAPGTLSRHPRNLALHAARVLSNGHDDKLPLEVLDAEVELFRETYPQLAFIAACRAQRAAAELEAGHPAHAAQAGSAAARRVQVLDLAGQVPACPQIIDWLLSFMPHRYGPRYDQAVEAATAEELRIVALAVDLALRLPEMSREAQAHAMASIIQAAVCNDDLPDAIRLVRELARTSAPEALPPPGLTLVEPVGAPLKLPLAELGIIKPALAAVATRAVGWNVSCFFPEARMGKARALLAQVPEADARRVLELCIRDYSRIEAETKQRMAAAQPTVTDHLMAARYLPAPQKGVESHLQHLAAASALTQDATQRRIIDHAILFTVRWYKEKLTEAQKTILQAAVQRLRAVEWHPAFSEGVSHTLYALKSDIERERDSERDEQERRAANAKADTLPYSHTASYKQYQAREKERTQHLIAALKARDTQAIAALGRPWLQPHLSKDYNNYFKDQMVYVFGSEENFMLLLRACRPGADSSEEEQLRYAKFLMQMGDETTALQIYTQMAERDVIALKPRLHAAFLLAETEPDQALAHLRSIRLELVLAGGNGDSPLAMFVPRRGTASHRAAVARLITRWITSTEHVADLAALVDRQTSANLIQMIQEGEREGDARFPYLNQGRDDDDFFIPEGPGAVAMQRAREAHDGLCRALLRLPDSAPTALAALASMVIRDDGDLSECARHAAALLRDPQARQPLREWLTADGAASEMYAGEGYIAVPSPMTILVRHAAQTKDFTTFETVSLPLIEQALGSSTAASTRVYARLFSAPESDYPAAAAAWLATRPREENPTVRSSSEVLNVWQGRALHVPLTDLLLRSDAARAQLKRGVVPPLLTRHLTDLVSTGRKDEALGLYQTLRGVMISTDAAERRRLIAAWQDQIARFRSQKDGHYLSPEPWDETFRVHAFAYWLQYSLREPQLVFLLPLGLEEGLLGGPNGLYQMELHTGSKHVKNTPEDSIALAEMLGFLGGAAVWRDYVTSPDSNPHTRLSSMAASLRDGDDTQPLRDLLAARKPQTLGSEIFAALLAHSRSNLIEVGKRTSEDNRDELLLEVLTRRHAELASIAPAQRRTFSLLLRTELTGYPDLSKFEAGLAAALRPFLDREADDLVPVLDRILAAKEWSDVRMSESDFTSRFPAVLAQAARKYPAKAEQVVRQACTLLKKSPEDDLQRQRGQTTATPVALFLRNLGQVPQVLGTSMSLAESEKLSLDPAWVESFGQKLTDYEVMSNLDQLAAIFTQSPLVADTAHFNDFVVLSRSAYDGVTLLDRVVDSLHHEYKNVQGLRQRLKAEPEQTFGIQLTLALLDSTAPMRTIEGYRPDGGRDLKPLIAFAEAHGRDFSRLTPAAAKVVRTLLERYLKPPAVAPDRVRELLKNLPEAAASQQPEASKQPPASLR